MMTSNNSITGLITRGIGGFYRVVTKRAEYECRARGIFRRREMSPLPGDIVDICVIDETRREGRIDAIHERRNVLERPAVANVDQLIAVVASESPGPDMELLDKMLITAEKKGISVLICVNKSDFGTDAFLRIRNEYRSAGYPVISTSSRENFGVDELQGHLKDSISVFAGQSGVGKSTLLNSIMKAAIMETGDVSIKIGRGRQTTRHAQLIKLPCGGYIADTPGFSIFELSMIKYHELYRYYPELAAYTGTCRFSPCSHTDEPDCNVKKALSEGRIGSGRYAGYVKLYKELKQADRGY